MAYNSKDTGGRRQTILTLIHGPCISGAIFISFKDMQQLGDSFVCIWFCTTGSSHSPLRLVLLCNCEIMFRVPAYSLAPSLRWTDGAIHVHCHNALSFYSWLMVKSSASYRNMVTLCRSSNKFPYRRVLRFFLTCAISSSSRTSSNIALYLRMSLCVPAWWPTSFLKCPQNPSFRKWMLCSPSV